MPPLLRLNQPPWARWRTAFLWSAALGLHIGLLSALPAQSIAITWVNNIFWFGSSAAAALACALTARSTPDRSMRKAWYWLASASASWAIGQLLWAYHQLVLREQWPYPSWAEPFYLLFAPLSIIGLLRLAGSPTRSRLTFRHIANLALLTCFFQIFLVMALLGPIESLSRSPLFFWIAAVRCAFFSSIAFVALFLLWSYRPLPSWRSMLFIAIGSVVYAVNALNYIRSIILNAYSEQSWSNAAWLVVFGCIACAAAEQRWLAQHPEPRIDQRRIDREALIEAVVPAALMTLMTLVLLTNLQWLSSDVLTLTAISVAIFAVVLGAREAWNQREEHRLLNSLSASNANLERLNHELAVSEARYRSLSGDLERLVVARTDELQLAYRDMESFAYAAAHDLKTPLRTIDGFSAMLAEHAQHQLDADSSDYVRRIRKSAQILARLIDDLLAYAHLDRREWRIDAVDLRALVEEIVEEQQSDIARFNAHVEIDVASVPLRIDREALAATLRNLLQNALKYSQRSNPPRIEIGGHSREGGVRLAVRDNGVGFDMNFHSEIFDVFKRLHRSDEYEGTGIGLAIVRRAVERMHGRVWADSQPGHGAVFFIDLPLNAPDAARSSAAKAMKAAAI